MTALDFANVNSNSFPVVRIAGNGCPAGRDIAWIPPETELPFDLSEVEGEVRADGQFEATNLNGPERGEWRFRDWNGNIVYALWIRCDENVWTEQAEEAGYLA